MFRVVVLPEVEDWFGDLDRDSKRAVGEAIDLLKDQGPQLGRPLADRIKNSRLHNMKELRPASGKIRILFVFDPKRQAVLLVAGDKTGQWNRWYDRNIPVAEDRYADWLDGRYEGDV